MARPQWQQVAPPNFASVFAGLESANQMTNAGLTNLQKAIAGFDNAQTAGANQEVLLRAMGFTDRDALQRAITDRSLFAGFTPNKINADTLSAVGNRQAALLTRATGEESLANTQYTNNRTREGNAATDAAAPTLARTQTAAAGYDPALGNLLATLSPQEATTAIKNLQGIQGTDTSNKSSLFNYRTTVRNDQESRAADAAVAALDRAGVNPATRGDLIRDANLNPTVEAMVRSRSPGADLTGLGGGGGTSSGRTASSDLFSSLLQTESEGQQFNKDGSVKTSRKGAIGIAQVMPSTGPEAAALAGVPWDESRFKNDSAYNAQLGKAYFDKQLDTFGGNAEMALAAYNAGPGATKNAVNRAAAEGRPNDWLSFLPKETQEYVPKTLQGMNQGAAQNLRALPGQAQRYGTNAVNENIQAQGAVQVGSNPDRILRAAAENISKDEAIKRGESLPAGKVQVDRMLEQARSMGVPYAAALEIASNATVPTRWGSFVDAVTPFDSNSRKIDESKFMEGLRNYNAPNGTLAQADTANQLRQAQQSTVQAQQAVQTATANLLALQQAKARNPYIPDSAIERQQAALDLAQASLAAAGQRTEQINKQLMDITPVGTSSGQPRAVTAPSTEPRTLGRVEATGTSAANGGDPFRDLRRNQNRTANINILR